MTLLGSAVSNARTLQKANATRSLITRLDNILQSQFRRYTSVNVDSAITRALSELPNTIPTKSAARVWYIRRNLVTGDLPDRWTDVQFMATPANGWVPQSAAQRAYIAIWNAALSQPTATYAGAECLFMIIMQGGLADAYDIGPLKTSDIGDKDQDGFQEFWDAWGNPIGYLLWPYGLVLPPSATTKFFADKVVAPFGEDVNGNNILDAGEDLNSNGRLDSASPTLGLRPLIYSAGPDGEYSFDRQDETANLNIGAAPVGKDCGNWLVDPTAKLGGLSGDGPDNRADNITNFDAEIKQ
jgi:hypothetical protein